MDSIDKNCKVCNKHFTVRPYRKESAKYCSKKCYDIRNGEPIKYNCLWCSKEFIYPPNRPRRCCSHSCANKYRNKDILEPKYANGFRKFWERRGIINKCERCNYNEHKKILGIHHKDRNPKNNKRENLEVLCPNCHSLEHQKHIVH